MPMQMLDSQIVSDLKTAKSWLVSTHLRAHEELEALLEELGGQFLDSNGGGSHSGAAAHLSPERLISEEGDCHRWAPCCKSRPCCA